MEGVSRSFYSSLGMRVPPCKHSSSFLLLLAFTSLIFVVYTNDVPNFLFTPDTPILVPGVVHISLSGFRGDGGFNYDIKSKDFQKYMESVYQSITPTFSREKQSDNYIRFFITYPTSASRIPIKDLESFIATAIVHELLSGSAEQAVVSISNDLAKTLLGKGIKASNMILIVNPSFDRIKLEVLDILEKENPEIKETVSQNLSGYNWLVNSIPTSVWVDDYVFMDTTASSVYVGPSYSTFGPRSPISFPKLSDYYNSVEYSESLVQYQAALGASLYSAVSFIFYPDISFAEHTEGWSKVSVPIMVFKNHGEHVEIDEERVSTQLRRIFHKNVQVDVSFGTHSLHDHKHLSMAVSKSIRSEISNTLGTNGGLLRTERQYLDADHLIVELRRAADGLAKVLLQSGKESATSTTLPVYIFSLHGIDPLLLLQDSGQVAAFHDSVIILSTNEEQIPIPFIVDIDDYYVDATTVDRHIISGVAQTQGFQLPYVRYSHVLEREEMDFSFAIGSHPFSPFARSYYIPGQFILSIRKNGALARLYKAIATIRKAIHELDLFAEKHQHGVIVPGKGLAWIEALYQGRQAEESPILYTNTVDRLHKEILSLTQQLAAINSFLKKSQYDDAFTSAQSFVYSAQILYDYTIQELEVAEVKLECCQIHYAPPSNVIYYSLLALMLSIVALFAPLFLLVGYWSYRQYTKQLKDARARANITVLPMK